MMAKKFLMIIFSSLIVLFGSLFTYFYIISTNNAKVNLHEQAVSLAEPLSDVNTFIQIHTNKIQLTGVRDEIDGAVHVKLGQVGVPGIIRNPEHEPDEFEMIAIEQFQENPELHEYAEIINNNGHQEYRYLQPLRVQESCLGCHGAPAGEKDPLNYIREGLEVGDLKGAITVTVPADPILDGVQQNTITLVTGGLIIIVLLSVIIYVTIKKTIVKPVQTIVGKVQKISDGDLTDEQETITSKDEIGELAKAAEQMKRQLRELIFKVKESSVQVTGSSQHLTANSGETRHASEEIASFIETIAENARDQSDKTTYLSETISNVTDCFNDIAEKTGKVAEMSQLTEQEAEKGKSAVHDTINQIHVIRDTVRDLRIVVEELSERSSAINSIINVISDISAQTNLLALNAAIEASRAGEHGKGFAVVAEEVRNLAEQSASSAKSVAELINKIQADTENVVNKMKYGYEEVEKGGEIAAKAGESFEQITKSITTTVREIEEVTLGTNEIAAHTVSIFNEINELQEMAQGLAKGSSEAADKVEQQDSAIHNINESSKQLAKLSEELLNAVQSFKV